VAGGIEPVGGHLQGAGGAVEELADGQEVHARGTGLPAVVGPLVGP
jgi:hypothetical protein